MKYTLKFYDADPVKAQPYMPLVRYLLHYYEKTVVPNVVHYQSNMLELLDGQILANRLGLIPFTVKEGCSLEGQAFTVENLTSQPITVTGQHFSNQQIEPLSRDHLIFVAPPQFKTVLKIDFVHGRGSHHARFSKIEGYAMKVKEQGPLISFDSSQDMTSLWQTLKGL